MQVHVCVSTPSPPEVPFWSWFEGEYNARDWVENGKASHLFWSLTMDFLEGNSYALGPALVFLAVPSRLLLLAKPSVWHKLSLGGLLIPLCSWIDPSKKTWCLMPPPNTQLQGTWERNSSRLCLGYRGL